MQIALSVEALGPQMGGIGRYTWELAQRLPGAAHVDAITFWRQGRWFKDAGPFARGEPRHHPVLPRWIHNISARRTMQNSLFHGTNFFLPEGADGGIVTVHDFSVLIQPECHPAERVRFFDKNFARSLNRAGAIITCSNTIREEAIRYFGVPPEKVTAVPLGVSTAFRPHSPEELRPVLTRYGLEAGCYGLSVATLDPRKQLSELLDAWQLLPLDLRCRWPLVLAGGDGWLSDGIKKKIQRGVAGGWARRIGYVPDPHLPALFAGSALFVYPSTYEGFGLPPIEAMASGVPVVVSNASCLPEVTRGAAMMIDPTDVEMFSEHLSQALVDGDWRRNAISNGHNVSGSYSWETCVDSTVSVYRSLVI